MPGRAAERRRSHPLRVRRQRWNRQLQRGRGSSARYRHHIGRCGRRGSRRPSLRAAFDALARGRRDRPRELRGAQRQLGHRGTGARDRASEADLFGMNREKKIETEQVDAATPPPRARVTPEFERKKDYLTGFLAGEKQQEPKGGAGSDLQASVVEVLKSIYDPEIPVDIYELGLIYDVDISEDGDATITMTLTTPH